MSGRRDALDRTDFLMTTWKPLQTSWIGGDVGALLLATLRNRLMEQVQDENSDILRLFSPEVRALNDKGDWYGEHLGKWMVASCEALRHGWEPELRERVEFAVDCLSRWQEESGYLGTYAEGADCRFMAEAAHPVRTWDIWNHAWLVLGLISAHEIGVAGALPIAERTCDLIIQTVSPERLLTLGNHKGLSALVVIEPLALLARATGSRTYLNYAKEALAASNEAGLGLCDDPDSLPVFKVGTGKIYQILWCLLGVLELAVELGDEALLSAVIARAEEINEHHVNPLGGPWGGIAGHKEVFNARGFFDPHGMVETCSSATWLKLNRRIFELTGEIEFINRAEITLLNSILGASEPSGREWIYFSFPNGALNYTYHWACCKSSGALAIVDALNLAGHVREGEVRIHNLFPAEVSHEGATIRSEPEIFSRQPKIRISSPIPVHFRTPTSTFPAEVMDENLPAGEHTVPLDAPISLIPFRSEIEHHGQIISQIDYFFLSRGPYAYATGLFDGYRKVKSIAVSQLFPTAGLELNAADPTQIDFRISGESALRFAPYYQQDQFQSRNWRNTWIQVEWQ